MDISRRTFQAFWLLLRGQTSTGAPALEPIPTRAFRYEDLPIHENGLFRSRQVLRGTTQDKFPVDLHESELPPGKMPHPPHQHRHEEVLLIREGQVDITIESETTRLGPGSVAYVASNKLHGWRNTGTEAAVYFVMALGSDHPGR